MKPYYQDDFVTLYNDDASQYWRLLVEPFALVTDPPYGTGWVRGGGAVGKFVAKHERPEWDVWSTDFIHNARLGPCGGFAIFSPLNRAEEVRDAIGKGASTVYWFKTNPRPNGPNRDAITVWPLWLPALQDQYALEFDAYNGDTPLHPCQKPLDLMMWVLGFIDPALVIVDPFAGSGTTLEAAKKLGRRSIGIERDKSYCVKAAERFAQTVIPFGDAA